MSEVWAGLQAVIGVSIAVVSAIPCMLGGRSIAELHMWGLDIFGEKSNRIWGRVVAPLLFATGIILLSLTTQFKWLYLLGYGTYIAASSLGYGGKTLFQKIWRRTLWSLLFTAASLPYVLASATAQVWTIYITQVLVGLVVAVIWGVTNPVLAPREEYIIKLMNMVFVPLMVL